MNVTAEDVRKFQAILCALVGRAAGALEPIARAVPDWGNGAQFARQAERPTSARTIVSPDGSTYSYTSFGGMTSPVEAPARLRRARSKRKRPKAGKATGRR
jgi:hypothetical protein